MVSSKEDLHILAEATGVVIADGLAVSECFQEGVAGKDLTLDRVVLLLT